MGQLRQCSGASGTLRNVTYDLDSSEEVGRDSELLSSPMSKTCLCRQQHSVDKKILYM